MPPADSIRERAMKRVVATLQGITVANGYRNTVADVQRFIQAGQSYAKLVDGPVLILYEGDDEGEDGPMAGPASLITRKLDVAIELAVRHREAEDPRSSEELMNTLRADVEQALMNNRGLVDGSQQLARDVGTLSFSGIFEEEGQAAMTCYATTTITYDHLCTDPALGR